MTCVPTARAESWIVDCRRSRSRATRSWSHPRKLDRAAVVESTEAGRTVAVKVTDCPNGEGVSEELTTVVVFALLTTCPPLSVPLPVAKLVSPL